MNINIEINPDEDLEIVREKIMKCNTCGSTIKIDCDWQQGRCPHRPPMLTGFHFRYVNLLKFIKGFFKRG
jgi:hypothetical protein